MDRFDTYCGFFLSYTINASKFSFSKIGGWQLAKNLKKYLLNIFRCHYLAFLYPAWHRPTDFNVMSKTSDIVHCVDNQSKLIEL